MTAAILFMPFIVSGPASHFFVVQNHDVNDHSVVIDVLGSRNISIITETYELGPKSNIFRKRPLGLKLPLSKGEFVFNVNVDNKTMRTYNVEVPHPHTMVSIGLYYEDYTGNVTPITVEVVAVE
ncbi:hypothetical protein [Methanococcoides burtonii]|uniref:hypothetical protein n=1 Tax=Methanococcoides burtonii TaxID=29291 RepID=UPI000045E064|nr:hypothetical protein [Methanococcoides burtonii]